MAVQRDPGTYPGTKPKKVKRRPAQVTSSVDAALAAHRAQTPQDTTTEIIHAQTGMSAAEIKAIRSKAARDARKQHAKALADLPKARGLSEAERALADLAPDSPLKGEE